MKKMKQFKKMISMIVAVVMVFAMTVPAMAEGEATGGKTITIKPSETVEITKDSQFTAYKILNAVVAGTNAEGKTEISYTVPDEMKNFYLNQFTDLKGTEKDFAYQVTQRIQAKDASHEMNKFAKAALAYLRENKITGTSGEKVGEDYVISGLDIGYYLVSDDTDSDVVSQVILDTTIENLNLVMKADAPTLDKKIVGSSEDDTATEDTDPVTDGLVSANNAAVGDKVPYQLTTKVPSMEGFENYRFVIEDTLSKGLTYNDDLIIKLNGDELNKGTDYKVDINEGTEETLIRITFIKFIEKKAHAGEDIIITYSANLNENAVIGVAGNPNKAYLKYSNDREIEENGTPGDDFDDGEVSGKSPEKTVKTFVTGLELIKINAAGDKLEDARFKIKGTRLNKAFITGYDFVENGEGTFYKLKDGTYTEEEPNDETKDQYADTGKKYAKVEFNEWSTVEGSDPEEFELEATVKDGQLVFKGLAAGTYTIEEIMAPSGYNMLGEPIEVRIDCDNAGYVEGENCRWTGTYKIGNGDSKDLTPAGEDTMGIITGLEVVNNTGTELPSTGGIGTTIFYIIGGILVVGAAILLVTKKRMSKEA